MTIEIGGFIGLAALIVGLFAWLRQDINRFETRMAARLSDVEARISKVETRISEVETHMETRFSDVETHMNTQSSELRERMAKLEGLLEGLRESITGRRAA